MTSRSAFTRTAFGVFAALLLAGSFVTAATGPAYAVAVSAVETV